MTLWDFDRAFGVVGAELKDGYLGGGVDARGVPVGLVLQVDLNVRVRRLWWVVSRERRREAAAYVDLGESQRGALSPRADLGAVKGEFGDHGDLLRCGMGKLFNCRLGQRQ